MRRLVVCSSLLSLACSSPTPPIDAATIADAGTDARAVADTGPAVVESFAEVGATTEGIALSHDASGGSVLYVGTRDGRIRRIAADGTVTDFASIEAPVGIAARDDGSLLACAAVGGVIGIYAVSTTGAVTPLITSGPGGAAFGLTNFVAIAPDDSIVFSDSMANHLFRADADGTNVTLVADISYANGLAFSPDGTTLYVASWDTSTLFALSFDAATGMYGTPTAVTTSIANIDGVVATSTGALALVTSSSGLLLLDPTAPATTTPLAPRTAITLPANGVFGDATFGVHDLFVTSLARPTIYVVHTE
jgi:sugar lactone lactonase YvrE